MGSINDNQLLQQATGCLFFDGLACFGARYVGCDV